MEGNSQKFPELKEQGKGRAGAGMKGRMETVQEGEITGGAAPLGKSPSLHLVTFSTPK